MYSNRICGLKLAARRIVFGKFLNCGQTCVAPDYIYVQDSIKDQLVKELINETKRQFTDSPLNNNDYGKIVNEKHFNRISGLINNSKVVLGGASNADSLRIEPTIMDNVPFVCIEPWYGRTDAIDFTGELKDREYSNHLDAGEVFEKSFSILFY